MLINPWTFVLEMVNFLILIYILYRLLYRPLRSAIDRRREAIINDEKNAQLAREQAAELQREMEKRLAAVERERVAVIRQAREQANEERERILSEADRDARRRREELAESLERERQDAIEALQDDLIKSAVELVERLLYQAADTTLHRQLTARLIETLAALSESERQRLREDSPDRNGTITVETARDLDEATCEYLTSAIDDTLRYEGLRISVKTDPNLIAGVRLRVGGHVWDASLAGQLPANGSVVSGQSAGSSTVSTETTTGD